MAVRHQNELQKNARPKRGFLRSLAADRSGNTIMIVAGALVPIMAMIGGGVDMSRSYLSQTRLQQACDAGVLAARKKLGQSVVVTGTIPNDVDTIGQRFFDANFSDGQYGTANRSFAMTLESDYSISGMATVDVPTTIMQAFGYDQVDLVANCSAQLNMSDTD
ncbi:MAG: TadE/TadG family type IV pilus assembly protein, partial [Novosphingobium sp.]